MVMNADTSYAGYDYFIATFEKLKERFPKVQDEVLIAAASQSSIACAIEQLAMVVAGRHEGPLNDALREISGGAISVNVI